MIRAHGAFTSTGPPDNLRAGGREGPFQFAPKCPHRNRHQGDILDNRTSACLGYVSENEGK